MSRCNCAPISTCALRYFQGCFQPQVIDKGLEIPVAEKQRYIVSDAKAGDDDTRRLADRDTPLARRPIVTCANIHLSSPNKLVLIKRLQMLTRCTAGMIAANTLQKFQ